MPPGKKDESAPPVSGSDRLCALPDDMLHHVLSFLPAQAAVRTCVLARRWRNLWRSTTGLRIVGLDGPKHAKDLRALDSVEIKFNDFFDKDGPYLKLWTRFAVMCRVRALTFHVDGSWYLDLDYLLLVSRHLRTLDLQGVSLVKDFIDFATCPELMDLKMDDCEISAGRISSPSLKHLSITGCFSSKDCRLHVCTPGLVSLNLVHFEGRTPFLENMTLLQRACFYLDDESEDVCLNYKSGVFCGANNNACDNCGRINDDCSSDLVLIGAISSAKHLELISELKNV
jgi:hypothetical protein